ncbi:MAG: methylated-DNA--[protein]-cysteine S-methyltransferase [Solirubrobacteraceae bacterium]
MAFERHDSPLGTILVGATEQGLVRVGLPVEREDGVLAELARRISPRVISAPRNSITPARNPLPILVPCHRVLRSDGGLGGYRGGVGAKAQLLDLERAA